jgi:hypothetical protein
MFEICGGMSDWKDTAHFMYEFWYADPLKEIEGLKEEQLFWVPGPKSLCILWHVGHIAHRERTHLGKFLQGIQGTIIPPQYDIFGTEWCSAEEVHSSVGPVQGVFGWVRDVRKKSHEYIESLSEDAFHVIPPTSDGGLSVAQWLFITPAHTALHIGRIQLLRALIENEDERVC